MKIKKQFLYFVGAVAVLFLLIYGFVIMSRQITYIERAEVNDRAEQNISIVDNQTVLGQEFTMPYELFYGIDVKIGTFGRNNNSIWKIELSEKESGKKVYTWNYNASQVSDGEDYYLEVKSPVEVRAGGIYILTISSDNCTGDSALAFYTSSEDVYDDGNLTLNGEEQNADLCLRIYGGEKDSFWIVLYAILVIGFGGMLFAIFLKKRKGQPIDRLLGTLITALGFMLLMYIFSRENMGNFADECDSIQGGMLIAKGKVLYRDYYTQHTPFVYYLCGAFALLGAQNIQQYRLLYYLVLAVVWAALYYRHSEYFGKIKMFMLPVLQVIITAPMFFQSYRILGDNIQGLCMVVLLLEYFRYWSDNEIGRSRSLIIAACIYVSMASAFISAFSLAPIVLSVIVKEIYIWKEKLAMQELHKGKAIVKRYGWLVGGTAAPFVLTVLYFYFSHAIRQFYQMAYQFNTMVYNEYQEQYGRVKWKPFFLGVKNYLEAVKDNLYAVLTAAESETAIVQLILSVLAVTALLLWAMRNKKEKRWIAAIGAFLCMSGSVTRSGTDFHSIAMWNMAVAVIVIIGLGDRETEWFKEKRAAVLLGTVAACLCVQPYMTAVADHVVYYRQKVNDVDEQILAMTEPGDTILIDTTFHDAIYLMSKDRYPANRNCYFLPWYMDWYEYDTIEDMNKNHPVVAVYNPEVEIFNAATYYPVLNQEIQSRYERLSEDSMIWKLK